MIIIYDGTFSGLLTLYYGLLKNNINPLLITKNRKNFLSSEIKYTKTDSLISDYMFSYIKDKTDYDVLRNIYLGYLSKDENVLVNTFNYMKKSIISKKNLIKDLSDYDILKLNRSIRNTEGEAHRFLGLVRFRRLNDESYYSVINPDNDILPLMAGHFKNRLNEKWIIHDINRNYCLIYDKKNINYYKVDRFEYGKLVEAYHEEEKVYQNLWNNYHESIAIKERENRKLQFQFIPVRYWKYLIEKY
ncbi:MAG: TIGR03915 family putative DNA repair protein [Thermotogae bacterium]|nr:TIGR03915 family putative DNA repair protein [Thermotogota bacterium]